MATVSECFGLRKDNATLEGWPLVCGTDRVGVEIELENLRDEGTRFEYWDAKHDGSLRGGIEFVFQRPTGGVDLYKAAVELDTYLSERKPDPSWRCSTHVHLDVREMTRAELRRLILIYAVYEKLLFRLSGMHRYHSNFCTPLGFAQGQIRWLSNAFNIEDDERFFSNLAYNWDKYSAINLKCMANYGSVEFRMSEPQWRKGKILLLCNRFLEIKKLAKSWEGTEADLLAHLVNTDPQQILGKGCPKVLPEQAAEDIESGAKIAFDIITLGKFKIAVDLPPSWNVDVVEELYQDMNREIPDEYQTVDADMFVYSKSPGFTPNPNVINWLRREIKSHGYWVNGDMLWYCNFEIVKWVSDMTGMGHNNLLPVNMRPAYADWLSTL